ncbi:MAG: hypothetical protein DMD99_26155, partial [Candidatus Rokuibacteriota bacterium]
MTSTRTSRRRSPPTGQGTESEGRAQIFHSTRDATGRVTVEISKQDFEWARAQGLISAAQVEPLWAALEGRARGRARFDFPHVTYYFGALVVMSAMGWFVNRAWERFGGAGLLLIAVVYALCFSLAGLRLWV